jgi:hypothetical protein
MARISLTSALALLVVPHLSPQQPISLDEVEALANRGRILEAREVLETWWEEQGARVGRLDRQRSLWLRARLTVDPSLAELDLRRLTLEYPGGPYSDDALLRLAQSADVRGDRGRAGDYFRTLLRGYPSSPHASLAAAWLREAGPDVQAAEGGSRDPGRVDFPRPPPGVEDAFSVQAGAFRDQDRARSLADQLEAAGYDARVVRIPADGLLRVRVGRYRDRVDADAVAAMLRERGFEATIVTDARSEERVR